MAEAVVNASPLIYLPAAGHLDLLRLAGSEIIVPWAVAHEIRSWGEDDPATRALSATSWLKVAEDLPVPESVTAWDLGAGESAVLAWALAHPGATAVIDDLAARRCASALGLPIRGTLGLVLAARRRGMIPSARRVVGELREAGMYISDAVVDRALTLVGE